MLYKQEAQQQRHDQSAGEPQAGQLLPQVRPAKGLIQPGGRIGEQLRQRQEYSQHQVTGQRHRDDPAFDRIKANPERDGQGQIQDQSVREDMEAVKQLLVLFYHNRAPDKVVPADGYCRARAISSCAF